MEIDIFDDDSLNKKLAKSIEENKDQFPIDEEEFVKRLTKAYQTHKEAASEDVPEARIAQNAWNKVKTSFRGGSSGGKTFEGILLAADEPNDMNKNVREEKKKKYQDEGQEALKSGDIHLIKQEGQDHYIKMVFDRSKEELNRTELSKDEIPEEAMQVASDAWVVPIRTEERYQGDDQVGEPIPENNYLRTVFGIAVPQGNDEDAEMKPFAMSMSGNKKPLMDLPFNKLVRFEASKKDQEKSREGVTEHQLNFTGDQFEEVEGEDPDIRGVIENKMSQYLLEIPELDEFERNYDDWNDYAIIKAVVSNINLDQSDGGNRSVVIEEETPFGAPLNDDEDTQKSVYCILADHVDVDFGEGSTVYVMGSAFRPPSDDGEVSDPMMTARGLYVPEDTKMKPSDEVEDVSEDDISFGDDGNETEDTGSDEDEEFSDEGVEFDVDDSNDEW
jgi:hypothetical protein